MRTDFKLHLFNSLRNMKITLSAIKADIGAIGGHTKPSDKLLEAVKKGVKENSKLLLDYYVGYTGDDIHIIMTHTKGTDNKEIHKMAWDTFTERYENCQRTRLVWCRTRLTKRCLFWEC